MTVCPNRYCCGSTFCKGGGGLLTACPESIEVRNAGVDGVESELKL